MLYQIAYFDKSGEAWHLYRIEGTLLQFTDLGKAQAAAQALSTQIGRTDAEVLVLTVHDVFKTTAKYETVRSVETRHYNLPAPGTR